MNYILCIICAMFLTFKLIKTHQYKHNQVEETDFKNEALFVRHNLSGVVVRATAPEGNLTQGEVVFTKGNLQFHKGFGVDVLYSLQIALGFKIKVITAQSWAVKYPNGSWFGMARLIIDDEADLSIAKTSILPYRAKELAYLVPTHGLVLYAFFTQPSTNTARNIFLDPFQLNLWITLVLTYLILLGSVKILAFIGRTRLDITTKDETFVKEIGIWSFYAVSQHGFHSPPLLSCFRIVLLSGIFLGLTLYVSYSAQLVTVFTIESISIQSISDLLQNKAIRITVDVNNRAARGIFEQRNLTEKSDKVASLLQSRLNTPSSLLPTDIGGQLVLKSGIGFLTFKDTFYTTLKNTYRTKDDEFCSKVSSVRVSDATFKSGLFVAKGSYLKEPFNVKIIAMYTSGLMRRFVLNYESTYTPYCDNEMQRSSIPIIEMSDVIFGFYGLTCGFSFAVFLCIVEFGWSKYKNCSNYSKVKIRNDNNKVISSFGDVFDK